MDPKKSNSENMKMIADNLRSVVQSCKGGVPFKCLERDYRDLLGTSIPYKEMNYSSLEQMIADMSDTIVLEKNNQNTLVARAVVNDATAHIASLVARQRATKKPVVARRRPIIRTQTSRAQRYPDQGIYRRPPFNRPSYTRVSSPRELPTKSSRAPLTSTPYESASYSMTREMTSRPWRTPNIPREEYSVPPRFKKKAHTDYIPQTYEPPVVYEPPNESPCITRTVFVTAKAFVDDYAAKKGIFASYKTVRMGQKVKLYISTLILDGHKYNSFPDSKNTPEEAEEVAANIAMKELQKVEDSEETLPVTPVNNMECISTLVQRIDEIVSERYTGIWANAIPKEYKSKYGELLPSNWLTTIKPWCSFKIEEVNERMTILSPHPLSLLGRITPGSTSSKSSDNQDEDKGLSDFVQKSLKVETYDIPMLQLPEENFPVFVSCVVDSQSIAVRLIDFSDEFEKLSRMMKEFYGINTEPVKEVVQNCVYAIYNDGCWNRVSVEKILDNNRVSCRYVDDGDLNNVNISDLQEVDPDFLKLPFQAVSLKLFGLEDYSHLINADSLVKYLLGNTLIAEVVDREHYSVILYDTSTDRDVNLNNVLKETAVLDALKFTLPDEGSTALAHMNHVSLCGDVYLHFECHGNDTDLLQTELAKITPICEERRLLDRSVSKHEIYCAKYEDGYWYRAIILDILNEKVEVFYVDYGNTSWLTKSDICELSPICKYLTEIPFQAVKCSLSELPPRELHWHEKAVNRLIELVPDEKKVIVKVEKAGTEDSSPRVSLFLRNENSGNESSVIISLTQTLVFDIELFSKIPVIDASPAIPNEITFRRNSKDSFGDSKNSNPISDKLSCFIPDVAISAEEKLAHQQFAQSLQSATIPNLSNELLATLNEFPPLHPPEVPEVENLFPVYISMVANPHNFMCQPWESSPALELLQDSMNTFYSNEENICEMHRCLVKEKHFYAGKHNDGSWYRIRIQNVVSEDPVMVSVYFVDYGDYGSLSLSNLQLLWKQFKVLPCQAMKASLSGVKPNGGDWNPLDCIAFRNRVSEKQFYAHVKAKRFCDDGIMECYKLDLILIDTVTDEKEDIYIHNELIKQNVALPSL